ncbi:MAG TPA: FAD-dependent oxidoreductase [Patescibacteria group bacterium]|nr:FAD-dependent oxidoreductase [Patescibacteria group bacterium]
MKIGILGGGMTGLTASYYASKKGYQVTLFEKENHFGGLASGFRGKNWLWPLERTYHHLFSNDTDIVHFAQETGFNGIFFKNPLTASAYENENKTINIYPFTSPLDLLSFPLLSPIQKIRASTILAFLKCSPFLKKYEQMTAQEFLQKTMGKKTWNILWQELFRKKFGKYAGNIVASFIWSRIKKRTRSLGYIEGGFQNLIDYLEITIKKQGTVIKKKYEVTSLRKEGTMILINGEAFDKVISTLPTPILRKLAHHFFPEEYHTRLTRINYLHAHNLIIETKQPFLDKIYWLNIMVPYIPFTVMVQHTHFIDKKNYNNHHLLYIGNYLERDDPRMNMEKDGVVNHFLPYIQRITNNNPDILNTYLFKGPFAQPIFDKEFIKNKPDFETPIKNFYIANLDMTYPHDRGTNYAVKLGKEVVERI